MERSTKQVDHPLASNNIFRRGAAFVYSPVRPIITSSMQQRSRECTLDSAIDVVHSTVPEYQAMQLQIAMDFGRSQASLS